MYVFFIEHHCPLMQFLLCLHNSHFKIMFRNIKNLPIETNPIIVVCSFSRKIYDSFFKTVNLKCYPHRVPMALIFEILIHPLKSSS